MARPRDIHDPPPRPSPSGGDVFDDGDRPTPPVPETLSEKEKFIKWVQGIGASAKTAADLWYWAGRFKPAGAEHADFAYYWASVLKHESNFKHHGVDSGQAYGIGQIAYASKDGFTWVGKQVPWEKEGVLFTNDNNPRTGIRNYGVNIKLSAYYLSQGVSLYGYDGAYVQHYNGGDPNKGQAWAKIQNTYHSTKRPWPAPSSGPVDAPDAGGAPVAPFNDPYVSGVKKGGKLALTSDAGKALRWDGLPIRHSDFLRVKRSLENIFVSYTGGRPSNAQVQQYIQKGWSEYTLAVLLSKGKKFKSSPLWKSKAPVYQEAAKSLLGPKEGVDDDLVRTAIVNDWTPDVFQAELRKRPGYVESNEFKGMTATMSNVYQSIYGIPDERNTALIQEAALAGWTPDQFAAWLRSQDEYVFTAEYRDKAVRLIEELGLMTGRVPVLQRTYMPEPDRFNPYGDLPDDERVKGEPGLPYGPALVGGARGEAFSVGD